MLLGIHCVTSSSISVSISVSTSISVSNPIMSLKVSPASYSFHSHTHTHTHTLQILSSILPINSFLLCRVNRAVPPGGCQTRLGSATGESTVVWCAVLCCGVLCCGVVCCPVLSCHHSFSDSMCSIITILLPFRPLCPY